ncbi:MAG: DinB family protein [Acidobacteriota bacterium]|nr:DinB family protein [Acidobacteriota bacterium]
MDLTDINQLFNYTEWANNLAMDAAVKLSDDDLRRDVGISHQSIFGTLLHMAGAEWIWLERWNGRSPGKAEAWSRWTMDHASCVDLAELKDRWMEVVDRRWRYLSELDDAKLTSELSFKLLSGDASSMRLVDQMQHVANHATMHRGQVVGMIRQLGIDPPSTDLLFYLRREISPK